MRPALNLPGSAAPALAAGMIAGSPAGVVAAVRCGGLTRSELERLACCICGLSPAFLITGVGAAMLGSPADGRLLLRAQVCSQLTMLLFPRGVRPDTPIPAQAQEEERGLVRTAVGSVLAVCGYMMIFSVAANLAARGAHFCVSIQIVHVSVLVRPVQTATPLHGTIAVSVRHPLHG